MGPSSSQFRPKANYVGQSKEAKGSRLGIKMVVAQCRMLASKQGEQGHPCRVRKARDEALGTKEWGGHPCRKEELAIKGSQATKQGEKGVHMGEVAAATTENRLYIGEMIKYIHLEWWKLSYTLSKAVTNNGKVKNKSECCGIVLAWLITNSQSY